MSPAPEFTNLTWCYLAVGAKGVRKMVKLIAPHFLLGFSLLGELVPTTYNNTRAPLPTCY